MAFKPITVSEEIKGVKYTAQFSGASMLFKFNSETQGDAEKAKDFLLENVLVEPKITPEDFDEYIGTDIDLMNDIIEFAGAVLRADKKYFPDTKQASNKKDSGK